MSHLWSVERFKMARSKCLFWILCGIAVITFLYVIGIHPDYPMLGMHGMHSPARLEILLTMWFPVFIAYFVAMEFQHKTINDALCLGKSRLAVYLIKLTSVLTSVAVMVLFIMVGVTVGLTLIFGFGDIGVVEYVRHFVQSFVLQVFFQFSVASLFLMMAFIVKTPTFMVIIGVGYTFVTWVGVALLQIHLEGRYAFIGEFLPGLVHMEAIPRNDIDGIIYGSIVSVIWIVVTTAVGYFVFKRTDLK